MKPTLLNKIYRSGKTITVLSLIAGIALIAAINPGDGDKKNGNYNAKAVVPPPHTEWKDYGGGPDHSKFVNFTQINKQNVASLQPAFVYSTLSDRANAYKFNPIIVDGIMYVLGKNSSLIAIDAITGKEIWIHANLRGIVQRGIN